MAQLLLDFAEWDALPDSRVMRQDLELGDQVRRRVHAFAPAALLLLPVFKDQSTFLLVDVARPQPQQLGDVPAGLPQALEQQPVGLAGRGVDDGPRLLAVT